MKNNGGQQITLILNNEDQLSHADKQKLEQLIYADLKRIAANRLLSESPNNTLTVTALVHEAFMRLDNVHSMTWKNRRHYYGAAAESMRRILIDRARYHLSERRKSAKQAISLDEGLILDGVKPQDLIDLDDAMIGLEALDQNLAEILKLQYYAGLSVDEIANIYEVSPRSIARKIKTGKAWLKTELQH